MTRSIPNHAPQHPALIDTLLEHRVAQVAAGMSHSRALPACPLSARLRATHSCGSQCL